MIDEPDEIVAGSGLVDRLVDRVMDNPAMSGGFVVMALTAIAVVSNAVFLQTADHPEPLFMTRPGTTAEVSPDTTPAAAPPVPRPRVETAVDAVEPQASPEPREVIEAAVPVPTPAPQPPEPAPERKLVRDLQARLAEQGLYSGKIDGISGSRTQSAIVAYQEAQGLPVTGKPTADILDHITTASVETAAKAPEPTPVAVNPAPAAEPPQTIEAVVGEPVAEQPEPIPTAADIAQRNRYLSVQRALNQIGYGPVAEDGRPGDAIDNAIRRFELDNGLPITGTPDDGVLERLIAIGALQST